MSETDHSHPIEFKRANSAEMNKAFGKFVDPDDDSQRAITARTRMHEFMDDNQLLLALHVPARTIRDYYHPTYATDALATLGDIDPRPKGGHARATWEQYVREQLGEFAATPYGQEKIAGAVGKYYREIAKRAVRVSIQGDARPGPYIRKNGDGPTPHITPVNYFGVSARGLSFGLGREYMPDGPNGKKYYSMNAIAEKVDWTIPGVEDPHSPVRDLIWRGLEQDADVTPHANPQALFALSSLSTSRGLVRAGNVFRR